MKGVQIQIALQYTLSGTEGSAGGLTKPYPSHMLLKTKQNDFGQYSGKEAKDSCHCQFKTTTSENVWET